MPLFTVIIVLVLELVFHALFIEGQEAMVYIGTGVNGSMENRAGNDIVVLGGLFAIHGIKGGKCGDIIDPSIQRVEAMVLATQKINDDSNLLPGVTLGFEIRETCTQTNTALEQSLNYVSGRNLMINGTILGISGVVGAVVSRVSATVARLLRLFQVPQISFASTANSLSDKSIFDYFFRTIPPDSLQAQVMADMIEQFNWTYVVAMHTGDIYGTEGIRAFICLLYTSPSPRDATLSRMPSSA